MLLYGFLLFVCLTVLAYGDRTVSEILKCVKYYRPFNTHKHLIEIPDALTRECLLQARFYSCIRKPLRAPVEDSYRVPLPEVFQKKEDALVELCAEGSDFREMYLMQAFCINRQDTEYCTSKEFLGADMDTEFSPEKRCLLTMKSRHCIATLINQECGEDASDLIRELTDAFDMEDSCSETDDEDDVQYEYEEEEGSDLPHVYSAEDYLEVSEADFSDDKQPGDEYVHHVFEGSSRAFSEGNASGAECEEDCIEPEAPERMKLRSGPASVDVPEIASESSELGEIPSTENSDETGDVDTVMS